MISTHSASRARHQPPLCQWIAQHQARSGVENSSSVEVRAGRVPGAAKLASSASSTTTSTLIAGPLRVAQPQPPPQRPPHPLPRRPARPPPPPLAQPPLSLPPQPLWGQRQSLRLRLPQPPLLPSARQQLPPPAARRARRVTPNAVGTTTRVPPAVTLALFAKPQLIPTRNACRMSPPPPLREAQPLPQPQPPPPLQLRPPQQLPPSRWSASSAGASAVA